jgi:hypothetical protein
MVIEKCFNGIIVKLIPSDNKIGSGLLEKVDDGKPSQLGIVTHVAANWDNNETPVVNDKVLYALAAGQEARIFKINKEDHLNLLPEEVIAIL